MSGWSPQSAEEGNSTSMARIHAHSSAAQANMMRVLRSGWKSATKSRSSRALRSNSSRWSSGTVSEASLSWLLRSVSNLRLRFSWRAWKTLR